MRLGMIGCGRVFERFYAPILKDNPHWEFRACCEPLEERREWVQQSFPGLLAFESLSQFLKEPPVDAVVIATPPETHCAVAIQALERGLHVLVEKPMALHLDEARLMTEASLKARTRLWAGFNRRFFGTYRELKKRLGAVAREEVKRISFQFVTNPATWKSVTPYLGDDSKGGGVLDDLASHQLNLLPWLLDTEIAAVRAECAAASGPDCRRVTLEVRLRNGMAAYCEAAHGDEYSEVVEVSLKDRRIVARPGHQLETRWQRGDTLRALFNPDSMKRAISRWLVEIPDVFRESFHRQLEAFAAATRADGALPAGSDALCGMSTLRAVLACRESLRNGGTRVALE
jgi:predicted dehydrogenase